MKFVADVMLGRLARLMRFGGYDVEYDRNADDENLIQSSRSRIVLTKDRGLAQRIRKQCVYLVQETGAEAQLSEIQSKFPLKKSAARCLVCNLKIRPVRKEKVEHLVPPFVFRKQESFHICRNCRRIYWQGTHYQQMFRMVK